MHVHMCRRDHVYLHAYIRTVGCAFIRVFESDSSVCAFAAFSCVCIIYAYIASAACIIVRTFVKRIIIFGYKEKYCDLCRAILPDYSPLSVHHIMHLTAGMYALRGHTAAELKDIQKSTRPYTSPDSWALAYSCMRYRPLGYCCCTTDKHWSPKNVL